MDLKLNVQSSPHVRDRISTSAIMLDVIIALIPATVWGILRFGVHAAIVVAVAVISAVLSETLFNIIVKKPNTIGDLSCVVTGLILGLNMPPEVPFFVPAVGSFFAIVIVKMLFGGLGQNFMNPALAGRCFCIISFAGFMNNFTSRMSVDAYTSATPLIILKSGNEVNLFDMLFGYIPGTIGEISAICLLLGAIYLAVKKIIDLRIPILYIVSFVIFIMIFGQGKSTNINYILGEVLGGGLIFGAFFMATDYATSPITPLGKVLYGILLGVLTGIFRLFGKSGESVSYVILISNLLVPLIESFTIPTAFGKEGK
ncbi:MAG: RnfABCDGE type electron transport complex subunit D [Lachnospiraceae bacterium]|nr:RnfABCDGE type electron transport complex subunit D [Lachnospiraceae bacterium]